MSYWRKIRSLYKEERVICDQIQNGEVPVEDRYLLARACVRNGFKEAYTLLSVLPEVNIIVEARKCDIELFSQLTKSDSYYMAMDDHQEITFPPIKVDQWYNIGQTYVNNHYDYKWNIKPEWELLRHFQQWEYVYNYDIIKQALNRQLTCFIWLEEEIATWIEYICYHAKIDECKIWLMYNIFRYASYIQHGIMTNLSFAKYCYDRQDIVCHTTIRRSILNMLIMNDIIPECDHTMPYCIWYPKIPKESTLRELVAKVPKLAILVGRVCAIAHYNKLYDALDIPADEATYQEAIVSGNEYLVNKLVYEERQHFMNDHTHYKCYSPDEAFMGGCYVHTVDKVNEYYSQDHTGIDEETGYDPFLYVLMNENGQTCDMSPSLQPGLGVQENSFLLN